MMNYNVFYESQNITRSQSIFDYEAFNADMTGFIYVGLEEKPINSIYVNVLSNLLPSEVIAEYYDGAMWQSLVIKDLTKGLSEPGFISWKVTKLFKKFTLGTTSAFFIRFRDNSLETKTFKGINSLFSWDYDLLGEYPTILRYLPENSPTFVKFHESARDELITDLRNTGKFIHAKELSYNERKQLDYWDLLDISEVRQAAKYLTLSKIFNFLSDEPGDRWSEMANNFKADAGMSLTPLITIDENQDGIKDPDDLSANVIIVGRL